MTSNTLLALSRAIKAGEEDFAKKIILFGAPGSAKTHIAATIAKVPSIKRVFWFDLENGLETVVFAVDSKGAPLLTDDQLTKIIPIRIEDTRELPRAAETLLKVFTSTTGAVIDNKSGKVIEGVAPLGADTTTKINIFQLTEEDAIVVDSGSQLADSVIHLVKQSNPEMKSIQRIFGQVNPDLAAILTGIQATKAVVVMCTHTLDITKTVRVDKNTTEERLLRTVPMMGSRPFSDRVAKYFGYKIHTYVNGSTHRATCKLGKIDKVLVSSRRPISFEDNVDPSLECIFYTEAEETQHVAEDKAAFKKPGIIIPKL